MKGPCIDDAASLGVSDGCGDKIADELAGTTIAGRVPVDATGTSRGPEEAGDCGVGVGCTSGVGVGWRTEEGIAPPVDPIMPPKSEERIPPAGALAEGVACTTSLEAGAALNAADVADRTISGMRPEDGPSRASGEDSGEGFGCAKGDCSGKGVGCTTLLEAGAAPNAADVADRIISGMRPEDGPSRARGEDSGEDTGDGVGCAEGNCSGEGVGCTITEGSPVDEPTGAGLGETASGSLGLGIGAGTREESAEDTGGGDGRWSGTGVTMISFIEVTVVAALSAWLWLTTGLAIKLDDAAGFKMGLRSEVRSSCRDSSC
jgi:hypothetical protein